MLENIMKIGNLIQYDRWLSIRVSYRTVEINSERVSVNMTRIGKQKRPHRLTLHCPLFPAKYNIPVLDYQPYLLDGAPGDFYLFSQIKSLLKGMGFQTIKALKEKGHAS